jgi:hypothetical protein
MSALSKTSLTSMKAAFPAAPDPIQGIPMLTSLINLMLHICRCSQTQKTPASATMDMLFCAASPGLYSFFTNDAYPTDYFPFNIWRDTDTSNNPTCQAFGNMSVASSGSTYVWIISESHILDTSTFNLYDAVRKETYKIIEDLEGDLYCVIAIKWNYAKHHVDLTMVKHVMKQLTKYGHIAPLKPQDCPYSPNPIKYGKDNQAPSPLDASPLLDETGKKRVQQIVGSFLFYARAVYPTILMALSEISSQQSAPTENTMTMKRVNQFLDYMWTHPDAIIRYRASDMILSVHSYASYLSAPKAHSRAGGYFFLGSLPRNGDPIKLNGAIHVTCTILKLVAASAAEAELGALFLNAQEAKVFRLVLAELGQPQPPTPIHINNTTTVGIVNNTIKRQQSKSMKKWYFWLLTVKRNNISNSTTNPAL